ncbi:hypothetical protein HS088_TW07G00008 [Tripterygium wilfordii]|uniref:Protein kinase domain-containing protein n=1 Tax=Tripterygium wilfordii TaxID=458696 RepID=A0A7J7DDK2_TRIWF|nr:hypothetical protein HS088_TW07G00008 [Tripterygium wilfordii]
MEIVGRVGQHPNVVPLRAYYYSKDEKLLVYDYIPGGSLSMLLHVFADGIFHSVCLEELSSEMEFPDMRPNMNEVVRMIEEVRQSESSNRPSSEENKSKDSNVQTP